MRVHMKGIAACFLGAACAALGACLLPEIGIQDKEEPPNDAGSDADSDVVVPTGCMHARYPLPPGGLDGEPVEPFVVALRSIYMGDGVEPAPGFDLDYTCTCFEDAKDSCSTKLTTPRCDGEGGIDNAAAKLFKLITDNVGSGTFGSDYYSTTAENGEWSLLLQISDYNGTPNDPAVKVALFVSPGLELGTMPLWQGTDVWPISPECLGPSGTTDEPLYTSQGAYVSDGVLVATLPSVGITFSGGSSTISVRFVGGVVTGRLVIEQLGTRIEDGIIAARWAEKDVFAALSSYRGVGLLSKICMDDIAYSFARTRVCSERDILTEPVLPASSPCDALSFGLAFTAEPALIGTVAQPSMPPPGCDPAQDPINDSCN